MKKFLFLGVIMLAFIFTSCTDYGDKVEKGKVSVYYKDGASEEDAQALLDFLFDKAGFTEETEFSFQLLKEGDTNVLNMSVKEGVWEDEDNVSRLKALSSIIKYDVFEGEDLVVHLCNDQFESQKEMKIE